MIPPDTVWQVDLGRSHTNYDIKIIVVILNVTTIFFNYDLGLLKELLWSFLGSHMPNMNYEFIVCSASVELTQ